MGVSHSERTGVLIVRVWSEAGEVSGLRARITRSLDISMPGGDIVSTASSIDEILAGVRTWLEDFVS